MNAKEAEFKPNYNDKCAHCDDSPTVDVYVNGELEHSTNLCGPCCWGEARALDPEEWGK